MNLIAGGEVVMDVFSREPAVIIGGIVLALSALCNAVIVDAQVRDAVVAIIVAAGALITRMVVYSPATVKRLKG